MSVSNNEMKTFFILNSGFKSLIENLSLIRKSKDGFFLSTQSEDSINYSDNIDTCLFYISDRIKSIINDFCFDCELAHEILRKLEEIKLKFYQCTIKLDTLKRFYEEYILNLSPCVCRQMDEVFFSYNPEYDSKALEVVRECRTINDIVHFLHTYIATNQEFYQNVPIIYAYESPDNKVYLRGEITQTSRILYEEYIGNMKPIQNSVEILDIGDNILILAGLSDTKISSVIDLTTPKINVDFKIIGDISDEQIEILKKILYKNGAQNLSIKRLKNGVSGLVICRVEDLANIISSEDGLINFVSSDGSKVKKKKGGIEV